MGSVQSDDEGLHDCVRRLLAGEGGAIGASYAGQGKIILPESGKLNCSFEALQLGTGKVLVFCTAPNTEPLNLICGVSLVRLTGHSSGARFCTEGYFSVAALAAIRDAGDVTVIRAEKVKVEDHALRAEDPGILKFAVTNLTVLGQGGGKGFDVELDLEGLGKRKVEVQPVEAYELVCGQLTILGQPLGSV